MSSSKGPLMVTLVVVQCLAVTATSGRSIVPVQVNPDRLMATNPCEVAKLRLASFPPMIASPTAAVCTSSAEPVRPVSVWSDSPEHALNASANPQQKYLPSATLSWFMGPPARQREAVTTQGQARDIRKF